MPISLHDQFCVTSIGGSIDFGLLQCYDLRFPELSGLLSRKGAEILTYPSAFTKVTGEAHWEVRRSLVKPSVFSCRRDFNVNVKNLADFAESARHRKPELRRSSGASRIA